MPKYCNSLAIQLFVFSFDNAISHNALSDKPLTTYFNASASELKVLVKQLTRKCLIPWSSNKFD